MRQATHSATADVDATTSNVYHKVSKSFQKFPFRENNGNFVEKQRH
jgi:hypothetical protein